MLKILLVEDNKQVAEVIYDFFDTPDYQLDYAATGSQGLSLAQQESYDCIILDIMLPGMDGLTVCKTLRNNHNPVPIIMLTARDTNQDMLQGLTLGADDYIVKPFDLELLEARIHAVIRRTKGNAFQQSLIVGELAIDLASHTVTRSDKEIKLNPSCYKILKLLMENHPNVTTREQITDTLWPDDLPDKDVLRKHIYLLRSKIDKGQPVELIKTLPKIGYKINCE